MAGLNVGKQNEAHMLDLLCAEEFYKRRARQVQASRLLVSLLAAVYGTWAGLRGQSSSFPAVMGLVASLTVLVGDRAERSFVFMAASVKDLFHARPMGVSTSNLNMRHPAEEEIVHRAQALAGSRDGLRNWYPDASGIPPGFGRLMCQRASVVWDLRLRRRVGVAALAGTSCVGAGVLIHGVAVNLSLQDFLVEWVSPLSALLIFLIQVGWRHLDAARERANILDLIERTWGEAVAKSHDVPVAKTTSIQDSIFRVRVSGPVVPKVAQRMLDRSFWREMSVASQRLRDSAPKV